MAFIVMLIEGTEKNPSDFKAKFMNGLV